MINLDLFDQLNENSTPEDITMAVVNLMGVNQQTPVFNDYPKVEILADSINEQGKRVTTFQLEYWRAIHSEHLRHRVFSINAGSSRAKPTAKIIEQVINNPWFTSHWGKNRPGMVASEEVPQAIIGDIKEAIYKNALATAMTCKMLSKLDVHKQVINRMLEPYSSIQVVCTATEWDNFFKLRLANDAEPNIYNLAFEMKKALNEHEPTLLKQGEWHLPYIKEEERSQLSITDLCKVSSARCARVSYKAFDGSSDLQKDLDLALRLAEDGHLSPLEHQAMADPEEKHKDRWANFRGWVQNRQMMF